MHVTTDPMEALGKKVKLERIRQRYSVKAAAQEAGIARDTWKRVEAGLGVQDTSRGAALELLGLDWNGERLDGEDPPAPELNTADMLRLLIEQNRKLVLEVEELRREHPETG